jgi:hypothetical protein
MSGCAAKPEPQQDNNTAFHRSYQAAFDKEPATETRHILKTARTALGTPYVRGGKNLDGFDCSGFVCWAYKSVGINLPRSAREQSLVGTPITRIEDMREGDIVAFRHPRRGYHTGIYVGDGQFIHSPRRRSTVRITSLSDPYFSNTFLGARRINFNGDGNLTAKAQSRLDDYTEQNVTRELTHKSKVKAGKVKSKKDNKAKYVAANSKTSTKKTVKRTPDKVDARAAEKNKKPDANSGKTHTKAPQKNPQDKAKKS